MHCRWLYVFLIFSISCQKDDVPTVKRQDFRLASGDSLRYHMGNFPSEGSITIVKQAKNYTISRVTIDTLRGGAMYEYVPSIGFKGQEFVEITRTDLDANRKVGEQITQIMIDVE